MLPVFGEIPSFLLVPLCLRFKKEMLSRHKKNTPDLIHMYQYISDTLYFSRSHFPNCLYCNTCTKTNVEK